MAKQKQLSVGAYWINDFSKVSKDVPLSHCDDVSQGLAKSMEEHKHRWAYNCGSYDADAAQFIGWMGNNGETWDNDAKELGCDSVDFAIIASHGTFSPYKKKKLERQGGKQVIKTIPGNSYYYWVVFGKESKLTNPNAFKENALDTQDTPLKNIYWLNNKSKLGDKKLKWIVIDACESLQLSGFYSQSKKEIVSDIDPAKIWNDAFYGLNMVCGFHGFSSDSWWTCDRGYWLGEYCCWGDGIAESWIDNAYSHFQDDQPVAMACGQTEEEAIKRLNNDTIQKPFESIQHEEIKWYAYNYRIKGTIIQ